MNRIKELRQARNWRQEDLASQLNVGKGTISKYEKEALGLDSKTVCALCRIFGVTADYLLCISDSPSPVMTDTEAEILFAFRAASEDAQAMVLLALKPWLKSEHKSEVS